MHTALSLKIVDAHHDGKSLPRFHFHCSRHASNGLEYGNQLGRHMWNIINGVKWVDPRLWLGFWFLNLWSRVCDNFGLRLFRIVHLCRHISWLLAETPMSGLRRLIITDIAVRAQCGLFCLKSQNSHVLVMACFESHLWLPRSHCVIVHCLAPLTHFFRQAR